MDKTSKSGRRVRKRNSSLKKQKEIDDNYEVVDLSEEDIKEYNIQKDYDEKLRQLKTQKAATRAAFC